MATVAGLVFAVLLSGCGALLHQDAVRLCRSLIPVLNGASDAIDVRRTDAARTSHGLLVTIAYAATIAKLPPERRAVSCIFREDGPAGRLDLTNLATEDGPVGEVRLYMIKRNWIDKGHAAVNDPAPIALSGIVLDVPTAIAPPLQVLVASLSSLGIYALLAAAYALIYGLIGRIHLAFGELAMLAGYGAFLGYWLGGGVSGTLLALAAAMLIGIATSIMHGAALGRFVFDRLSERPGQHILIATLGLSIAWSELARLSQGTGQRWISPLWNQPIGVARADTFIVTVTPMAVTVPLIATAAIAGILYLMQSTRYGRHWRAVADDPFAAELLGVSRSRVLGQTMVLASALAGLGGVLTLFAYGGVGHAGGLVVGLKALIAAVIGGIGSVRGAVLGAIAVGLAEAAWSYSFSIESRDLAIFCGLALVLILKPDGLFAVRDAND
jgi:branched-chain amino acid transport system permease protein